MNELIRPGIRHNRGSLTGVFIAVLTASILVTGLGVLIESGVRGGVDPERYVGADVVVGGSQSYDVPNDSTFTLPERAPLPADAVEKIEALPDVKRVVADTTTPMTFGTSTVQAHGWSAAALTPYTISRGHAPEGANQVVVDAELASHAKIGETITLAHGGVAAEYRVVGIARATSGEQPTRAQHVFVTDATASALAGAAHQANVVGVFARADASAGDLANEIRQKVPGVATYTGDHRGDAEFLDSGAARATLVQIGSSFAGTAILIALFVVAGTLSLSIQSRRRDFALMRAVGATPLQIHQLIAQEILVVAGAAAVIGAIPGYLLASLMRLGFAQAGVIPSDFALTLGPIPALSAIVLVVLASELAAAVAARRPARINPIEALQEASTTPSRIGRGRTITGVILGVVGLLASAVPLFVPGTIAVAGPAAAALFLIVAVALLGPRLVRGAVAVFGGPLRVSRAPSAFLASANARSNSRRLAAAIVPLALGIGLGLVQVGTQSIVAAEATTQSHAGVTADLLVTGGASGISGAGVASIAATPGVKAANPVVVSQAVLSYDELGDPAAEQYALQGIDPAASASTMDLDVTSGSLDDLTSGTTVALSTDVATTAGLGIGSTVIERLGDGTKVTATVVATYKRGLGFGDVTMTNDEVRAHTTTGLNNYVLVSTQAGAQAQVKQALAKAGYTVADRAQLRAAGESERNSNSLVSLIALGVILGYIAIAVVNTLVMATGERRREYALLQLIGSTRRQVRAMMRTESVMVAVIAAAIGTLVAIPPLVGISFGISGQPIPDMSPLAYIIIVGSLSILGLIALALGTRSAMRTSPIAEIGSRQ